MTKYGKWIFLVALGTCLIPTAQAEVLSSCWDMVDAANRPVPPPESICFETATPVLAVDGTAFLTITGAPLSGRFELTKLRATRDGAVYRATLFSKEVGDSCSDRMSTEVAFDLEVTSVGTIGRYYDPVAVYTVADENCYGTRTETVSYTAREDWPY